MSLSWCFYELETLEWHPSALTKLRGENGGAMCVHVAVPVRVVEGAAHNAVAPRPSEPRCIMSSAHTLCRDPSGEQT